MQGFLNTPFLVHACCIPVKGYTKSIMYDLNRCTFDYIPNDLFNILDKQEGNTIADIKLVHEKEDGKIIEEYFNFLLEKEYIFFCEDEEELQRFPKIDRSFEFPGIISNAIMQFESAPNYNILPVILQLSRLGCRDLQLAFYNPVATEIVGAILDNFDTSSFKSIEILIPFCDFTTEETLNTFSEQYKRLSRFYVFASPFRSVSRTKNQLTEIVFSANSISKDLYCPVNSTAVFRVIPDLFWESLQFNPYLSGKMCIDSCGNIRNAPNSEIIFGNIKETQLDTIANSADFTALWKTRKDDICICKDCEYRYMCTDGRIPFRNESEWDHRISCGYNVYNGKWGKRSNI